MAYVTSYSVGNPPIRRAILDIAVIAALWSLSSVGYYAIRDQLGLANGYRDAPFVYAVYYLGFTMVAVPLFRHRLRTWHPPAHGVLPIIAVVGMIVAFTVGILPVLPEIDLSLAPRNPPEFMFADAMYYVAKSFEILFQQLLILTLVLVFHSFGWRMLRIGIVTAALFGLFHLSLVFNGATSFYVARFTIAATCFGAVVPSLILATRNGATLSFGLHWGFYVADNIFTHFMLSSPS
ncbi:hypothetical protein KUH32_17220 [Thalassococcus sp. CAU 1522]|uniref:CPBP family intramembrane metalloprotease n=1 Tax=Thalassococcus arenae TaxID=2851652 RepID=A0ABS6NBW2_9RHOB|nr:hypothetical protein [Thalassococcus arenae]MBV2361507.1 hypothetical protein [Thalassococcus arenae]